MGEKLKLSSVFDSLLRPIELTNRTASVREDAVPTAGDNYDLYLLRNESVLSALCRGKSTPSGKTLFDIVGADRQVSFRVRQYLTSPSSDFLALALPVRDRIMLVSPVGRLFGGEGIVVVPHIGACSMARTLCYSFSGRVELDAGVKELGRSGLRRCDEATYLFLERFLTLWRQLTGGRLAWRHEVPIDDRRVLSRQLLATGRAMLSFLGKHETEMTSSPFPVPYPFFGTYDPTRAAWMLLCLYCGLCRSFAGAMDSLRVVMDNERLLPMIELTAGNRTPLPPEWEECARVAEQYGMFFEVKRTKNTVSVCLCPMTPNITPTAFFAMRAPVSVLWQLRSSVKDNTKNGAVSIR